MARHNGAAAIRCVIIRPPLLLSGEVLHRQLWTAGKKQRDISARDTTSFALVAAQVTGRHNPHAFRHGWARAALAAGADISDVAHLLGHRDVQTTYQFYGRWDAAELHALHDRYTWLPRDIPEQTEAISGVDLQHGNVLK